MRAARRSRRRGRNAPEKVKVRGRNFLGMHISQSGWKVKRAADALIGPLKRRDAPFPSRGKFRGDGKNGLPLGTRCLRNMQSRSVGYDAGSRLFRINDGVADGD